MFCVRYMYRKMAPKQWRKTACVFFFSGLVPFCHKVWDAGVLVSINSFLPCFFFFLLMPVFFFVEETPVFYLCFFLLFFVVAGKP